MKDERDTRMVQTDPDGRKDLDEKLGCGGPV